MAICLTEKPPVNLQELEEYARKLDTARGNFQIATVLNLEKSGEFLVIF